LAKEPIKSPIDKLLDSLSSALEITVNRQKKLTIAIKALSNLKNNAVDEFGDELSKEAKQECMDKCKKILGDNS